jgi:FMN phosphatase YigB (HAD superfamily)
VLRQLDATPEQTWMIGDSQRCDRDGLAALGIRVHYLQRTDQPGTADHAELATFTRAVLSLNR